MNLGFAVVDFETTGLSPAKGDRAIEIGLVHVAPDGTLEDEHETLIHVDRSVGASWVHHITARDLLHAPDFEGIAHELRDLLAGRVFVAHNVSFDSRFLLAEYSRMGASIPVHQSTMLCTMKLSRSLIGRGKLSDCCDYFGIANEDAHSALSDAHATALLLGRRWKPIRIGPASSVVSNRPRMPRNSGPHSPHCRKGNGCRVVRTPRRTPADLRTLVQRGKRFLISKLGTCRN